MRDDTGRVRVGTIRTDTIRPCNGWIYWIPTDESSQPMGTEIRRWQPGSPVEIVYRATTSEDLPTYVTCSGGHVVTEVAHLGRAAKVAEAFTALVAP